MSAFPSTTHVTGAVRDLPMSLPYHRLFGAQFVADEDTGPFRRAGLRDVNSSRADASR